MSTYGNIMGFSGLCKRIRNMTSQELENCVLQLAIGGRCLTVRVEEVCNVNRKSFHASVYGNAPLIELEALTQGNNTDEAPIDETISQFKQGLV